MLPAARRSRIPAWKIRRAVAAVLHNPSNSKSARMKAGLGLTTGRPIQ